MNSSFLIPIYIGLAFSIVIFISNLFSYYFLKKSNAIVDTVNSFYGIGFNLLNFKKNGIHFKLGYIPTGGEVTHKIELNEEDNLKFVNKIALKLFAIDFIIFLLITFFINNNANSYQTLLTVFECFYELSVGKIDYETFSVEFIRLFNNTNSLLLVIAIIYIFTFLAVIIKLRTNKIIKIVLYLFYAVFAVLYLIFFYKIFTNISLLSFGIFYVSALLSSLVFLLLSSLLIKN